MGKCEPTSVSAMTGANQDCVVGSWSRETTCSQSCAAGLRTRSRYVVTEAKGSGLKCPVYTCGNGCISQNVTCNGAVDNPLLCATCMGANNCRCRTSGALCDGTLKCDSNTCRSPSAPPLGCEGCECRADPVSPCEFGLVCRDGTCQALERGCAGCVCEADLTCNLGLTCGGIKVCVVATTPEGSVTVCREGTKDCPCLMNGMCTVDGLVCSGQFCRALAATSTDATSLPSNVVPIILGIAGGILALAIAAAVFAFLLLRHTKAKLAGSSRREPAQVVSSRALSFSAPAPAFPERETHHYSDRAFVSARDELSYSHLHTDEIGNNGNAAYAPGYAHHVPSIHPNNHHYDALRPNEV